MTIHKKKAAAIAAVMSYINTEEEAAVYARAVMIATPTASVNPVNSANPAKLWGISSRQDIMQMRNLMQMKAFHGKFRR